MLPAAPRIACRCPPLPRPPPPPPPLAQHRALPRAAAVIAYRGNPSLYESSGWNVSQAALAAQVAAASRDYAPASVAFRAASTTWHTSQLDWAKDCETQMFAIAGAVVRDPARSLNVVLCEPPTALGFAINLPTPWGFDENTPGQVRGRGTAGAGPAHAAPPWPHPRLLVPLERAPRCMRASQRAATTPSALPRP